jgi:hypothetical protein
MILMRNEADENYGDELEEGDEVFTWLALAMEIATLLPLPRGLDRRYRLKRGGKELRHVRRQSRGAIGAKGEYFSKLTETTEQIMYSHQHSLPKYADLVYGATVTVDSPVGR